MQYFDTLPKLIYTNQNGSSYLMTDILSRANIIPENLRSPLVYYSYDIQDSDTPELIAYKYYGDSYRYWIILFANELLDPQWNWPLNGNEFLRYLNDKYGNEAIYSEIHHYEKIITQTDNLTDTVTVQNIIIDEVDYYSLMETTTTYSLPSGTVTVAITKKAVSVYEYENNLNESKRNIKLLNSTYVDEIESELIKLMSK